MAIRKLKTKSLHNGFRTVDGIFLGRMKRVSSDGVKLYMTLLRFVDMSKEYMTCNPSRPTIQKESGLSNNKITKSVSELEVLGFINKHRHWNEKKGCFDNSSYTFIVETDEELFNQRYEHWLSMARETKEAERKRKKYI